MNQWLLQALVNENYSETNIITKKSEVPAVYYLMEDGSQHRYYIDIYLPQEMRMIEVKSTWTLMLDLPKIEAKRRACVGQGFKFEIWVMDRKGQRLRLISDLDPLIHEELAETLLQETIQENLQEIVDEEQMMADLESAPDSTLIETQ